MGSWSIKLSMPLLILILFVGCAKSTNNETKVVERADVPQPELEPIKELTLDSLVGKWIVVDPDDNVDTGDDYLLIEKKGEEYIGHFHIYKYDIQGFLQKNGDYLMLVTERGSGYRIGRSKSTRKKVRNGIFILDGDADLGTFQREDVLKILDNE